jgi:general secretion pathway protein D
MAATVPSPFIATPTPSSTHTHAGAVRAASPWTPKAIAAEAIGLNASGAAIVTASSGHCTAAVPPAATATPTIAPVRACVVDTGRPTRDANSTHAATPPIGVTAGILNGNDFSLPLLLYALQTRRDTNVLNVPSVLVNNTGSAKVVSTDEQPTTTITATGGLNGQTQENFREYVKAGITLQISPTISASRYLRLKITLEVSTFLGAVSGAIPPPKVTRTIDTTVNVPDGDTMVIGGIVTDNKGKTRSGVPFLSDIPILGALFRRDGASSSRTTLYFFVTPHIMRDRDFADLAEISYKKKLDAADIIGADRVRVIDPSFGQKPKGVDMRGFELPLYRSPVRGEVQGSAVGIEPGRVPHMLKNETRDRENASDPDSPPESEPTPAPEKP